jgi:S-adenosylmethionine:tRNA ribosyltransferase-isomerase
MEVRAFDFTLPQDLIALEPASKRDASRLLVLSKKGIEHRFFYDLPGYLNRGDMLLLNDTKVIPVRLIGKKPSGGTLEILLVREKKEGLWDALWKGRYTGILKVSDSLSIELREGKEAILLAEHPRRSLLEEGLMPLPPYIKRRPHSGDRERYQTVYAERGQAIAAPTAGLHFTKELLEEIFKKGVLIRKITLNVGKGTFIPIKSERVEGHRMEEEEFELDTGIPHDIEKTKSSGGRVFAVGTTTTRALEGYLSGRYVSGDNIWQNGRPNGRVKGRTDIFIYPGYRFKAVDSLITNFHLPRSTPLMLASALAGRERLLSAYREAVSRLYRFFSYGDAMLILD